MLVLVSIAIIVASLHKNPFIFAPKVLNASASLPAIAFGIHWSSLEATIPGV